MGKYPELGTVSRFSSLNIQNLLYMQAELIGLQQDLHEIETVNDRSPDEVKSSFSRNWLALRSAEEHEGSDEQWKLVLLIREKLKEYSECNWIMIKDLPKKRIADEAVVLCSEIASLSSPSPRDLAILQEWMQRPTMGSVFLIGRDRNVWSHGQDLIALKGRDSRNRFSNWIVDKLTPLYHYAFGRYYKVTSPFYSWKWDWQFLRNPTRKQPHSHQIPSTIQITPSSV